MNTKGKHVTQQGEILESRGQYNDRKRLKEMEKYKVKPIKK
jgi:hypothetical protein